MKYNIFIFSFLLFLVSCNCVSASWLDDNYDYRKEIILTGSGNISKFFNNPIEDGDVYLSTKRTTEWYIFVGKFLSDVYRGYSEWDISTIPSDAIITKAIFKYHGCSNAEDCIIKNINIQPSISSASNIYTAIGDGDIYADSAGFPEIGNNKQIVLNDNATSDIQSAISTNWFAVGFINKDENNFISEIYSEDFPTVTPNPTLYVEYTSVSEGGNNQTDYQLLLNVTYEPEMQPDFDDLRFCNETHELDSWLESKVDDSYALVWVKFPTTPANGVNQTYYMYYGNAGAASDWDGGATFLQYHGAASTTFLDALNVAPTNIVFESKARATSDPHQFRIGVSNTEAAESDDCIVIVSYPTNKRYTSSRKNGLATSVNEIPKFTTNTYYKLKIINTGSEVSGFVDDDQIGGDITTNIPTDNVGLSMWLFAGSGDQLWSFARKYAVNPPTYAFGSEEYYIPPTPTTLINETKLIMSEITTGLKSINMGNYSVYAFILIGILLIILGIQIITNNIYRG